ncbi:MAG: FAD-dependent oxidoreductase [Azospirillaceae bacterium]|nr:FAD-dependent oxidoreductase [Azospirillaceae bacterium]
MDRQRVQEREAQCIQEQPPACNTGCPLHVDVRGMMAHLRLGEFSAAFGLFARSVPFPAIIGRICDHPCERGCKRSEAGMAITISALERAAVAYGYGAIGLPKRQKVTKKKRVAIIGAGLSGLTVAYDLALKGRDVVVFEAGERPLARLRAMAPAILPEAAIDADLAALHALGVDIRCRTPVGEAAGSMPDIAALLTEFDALYLGPGPVPFAVAFPGLDCAPDGRIAIVSATGATSHPRIFAGGGQRYGAVFSPISSVQDGRFAALSIDRVLQGASLTASRDNQGAYPTLLYTDTSAYSPLPAVIPTDPAAGLSRDEAIREASRCFPCQCLECVKRCEYLAHYGAYPKRYVREIYNNDSIVLGTHKSNRMVNSCSLCGVCTAVCPQHLDMAAVCLEARRSMVDKGKMPPSLHDFALRDMAFSTGPAFALARHQPGRDASAAVFFPGCQLSASSPDHVIRGYAYLRETIADGVGLILGCCGAPAQWAGRSDLYEQTHADLAAGWERLGRPMIITACANCQRMLQDRLPEAPVVSIWTVFEQYGLPAPRPALAASTFALHDPCTTHDAPDIQKSVRHLLTELGVPVVELNEPGLSPCCGFGGLMSFANPDIADKVVDRRIGENDADYLTYCAMCRDNFARRGKRSVHLLDLIFGTRDVDPAGRPDPGFSGRQENRARLKTRLLKEVWGEPVDATGLDVRLFLSPEVAALAERRLILRDEIRAVIASAEKTGEKIVDTATGHLFASRRLASVTYWVEYTADRGGFTVYSLYSHRMQLGMEPSP